MSLCPTRKSCRAGVLARHSTGLMVPRTHPTKNFEPWTVNFSGQNFRQARPTPKKNLASPGPLDRASDHQSRGRQSAVDKKRGHNPVKEAAVRLAKPAGAGGEEKNFPSGSRTAWPQIKNPNSPTPGNWGLHPSCLVLTSADNPYRAGLSVHPTGRFSGSWINLLPAPSQGLHQPQWPSAGFVPNYSGGTATVLHRLPSSLMGPVSFFIVFLLAPGVKGNHRVRSPGPTVVHWSLGEKKAA